MKYCFAALLPLILLLSVFSCTPDDEMITKAGDAKLEFSTDTIFFDTVFVSTGSVSKRLKIYNRNDKAVKISEIKLDKLGASDYDLIIDGEAKDIASNITLRGNDSLLILVKVFIDPTNAAKPFIIEDDISFLTNGNNQKVHVTAYGQNANFFHDEEVTCNAVWEGPKAYVLFGGVEVKEGCTLTIKPGTRVYAHAGAALIVYGTLKVEGNSAKKVYFQNDRLDSAFNEVPGQWLGVYILKKSNQNHIQYAEIKNSLYGLSIQNDQGDQTKIENTVIKNVFAAGLLGVSANIKVTNSLFTNCGQYAIIGVGGGNYDFNFCTVANYTPTFKRDTEAFAFSDTVPIDANTIRVRPTLVNMQNSIIWNGTRDNKLEELLFLTRPGISQITISNSLLETNRYKTDPRFTNSNNILNQDPKFTLSGDVAPFARRINYTIKKDSPAIGGANSGTGINIDLRGEARPQGANPNPDMGAYETAD